jgi:MFS family permease
LAKAPLHLTEADIRWLVVGPPLMLSVGGFASSAVSDHWSRKTVMLIGVVATTFFTLLIPLVQNAEQLIILRLLTGLGAGGAVSAAFPIAAELMPAQHRRTYGATYEMALAVVFTVQPFIAFLLAGNPYAFRLLALPGGLALFVVPVLVYLVLPKSPRWHLRKGRPREAVDIVNQIITRSGSRVAALTVEALGDHLQTDREQLPPYWALFRPGQLRWTTVGIVSGICAGTAGFLIHVLLPKALVDQGAAVTFSFGLSTLVYFASIPGKAFTGFLMEVIGRRWTIAYALAGSLPGLFLMLMAHRAGQYASVMMVTGALITGFTVLSAFSATRVYLSEQFPTALRGRGHIFGESFSRLFAGVLAPFLIVPHTGSPTIFFGTILVVVAIGAFIPLAFGRETVGQLETVTEGVPAPA